MLGAAGLAGPQFFLVFTLCTELCAILFNWLVFVQFVHRLVLNLFITDQGIRVSPFLLVLYLHKKLYYFLEFIEPCQIKKILISYPQNVVSPATTILKKILEALFRVSKLN